MKELPDDYDIDDFQSPDIMKPIPLPPLSKDSIRSILIDKKKICPNIITDEDFLTWIHEFTNGIPRAIYIILRYFRHASQMQETPEDNDDLRSNLAIMIEEACGVSLYC